MVKDINIKKEELSLDELENVTGGTGETFDMEHMQEYLDEIMKQNDQSLHQGLEFPHSKKEKGRLFR